MSSDPRNVRAGGSTRMAAASRCRPTIPTACGTSARFVFGGCLEMMKKVGPKNPFGITDRRAKPATEAQVKRLERRLGVNLPEDYRRFLMTINGGRRGGGWEIPKRGIVIDTFYGLRDDSCSLTHMIDVAFQE